MKKRRRFTYIPKDEIAEVVTFNNVSFSNDDLLDGAYIKGRKKFAKGGKTSKRVMSLEEQAAESVGYDVWYQMEAIDQKELVEELLSSGMIMPLMARGGDVLYADGGAVATRVVVKYILKDNPKVVKESDFEDEDDAQLFYDIMVDDEEVLKLYPIEKIAPPAPPIKEEKVAEKPKKSLFEKAKVAPATTSSSKKTREKVQVDGIATQIARYDQLKATINNAKAEQEVLGGILKEIGREKFLDLYEQRGSRPANFDLADGDENILLEVTDKYLKVEPEKANILRQYDGLLEEKTTYEFNSELLEKEVSEGMTIGDVISALIEGSELIPEQDKANLLTAKQSIRVPKGTLDRLMQYENPRQIFQLISPILALK